RPADRRSPGRARPRFGTGRVVARGDLGVRPDRGGGRADVAASRRDAAAGTRVAGTAPMTSPKRRHGPLGSRRDCPCQVLKRPNPVPFSVTSVGGVTGP